MEKPTPLLTWMFHLSCIDRPFPTKSPQKNGKEWKVADEKMSCWQKCVRHVSVLSPLVSWHKHTHTHTHRETHAHGGESAGCWPDNICWHWPVPLSDLRGRVNQHVPTLVMHTQTHAHATETPVTLRRLSHDTLRAEFSRQFSSRYVSMQLFCQTGQTRGNGVVGWRQLAVGSSLGCVWHL